MQRLITLLMSLLALSLAVPLSAQGQAVDLHSKRWIPIGSTVNAPFAMAYAEEGSLSGTGDQRELWMLAVYTRKGETQLRVIRSHWEINCTNATGSFDVLEAYEPDLETLITRIGILPRERRSTAMEAGTISGFLFDYACNKSDASLAPISGNPIDYAIKIFAEKAG